MSKAPAPAAKGGAPAAGGKKEITKQFMIQAPGGAATPAPPLGPALGANGVNPGQFITQFNAATAAMKGSTVRCMITVYKDRSFTFELKCPPASSMIAKAAGVEKGSGQPNTNKVGKVTKAQLEKIAAEKGKEMTGLSLEAYVRTLAGTARSMGIEVVG